jgi:hypothetical protein
MTVQEHVCQFFDTDESRAKAVAAYVAEGLAKGERVLIVARPVYWATITSHLASSHIDANREIDRGRIIIKDAVDTLRRLSRNGAPDAAGFLEIIAGPVRELTELGPLRAYGEMVDILAQRGELNHAVALEHLWTELTRAVPLTVMCGYAAAHFVSPTSHAAMRDICAAHTAVRRGDDDALADWLLTAAHHPLSSTLSH